jgi:hypothetical protein
MKGLIIDEPWISKILRGEKTWEMRRTLSKIRGRIALIRKGSGQVVGVADVVACNLPVATLDEYAVAERFHGIPPAKQAQAFALGWKFPWVLANSQTLPQPVRYTHPSGAVIWVNLAPDVERKILAQAA